MHQKLIDGIKETKCQFAQQLAYYDNEIMEIPPYAKATAIIVVANDEVK